MPRLTTEVLKSIRGRLNPLGERELSLKGLRLMMIENLSVLDDGYDVLDISDNQVRCLDDFPIMNRLTTLIMHNNLVETIEAEVVSQLPNLHSLVLTNNLIANLIQLDVIKGWTKLEHLTLLGNPVANQKEYRLYCIYRIPSLKMLDFRKVTLTERNNAKELFEGEVGQMLIKKIEEGVVVQDNKPKKQIGLKADHLTADQKAIIRHAIQNANGREEIDKIENMLRNGTFPFDQYGQEKVQIQVHNEQ
jgi:U2 small nuclear ribonucleoprotein A'